VRPSTDAARQESGGLDLRLGERVDQRGDGTVSLDRALDRSAPAPERPPDSSKPILERLLHDADNQQFTVADNGFHALIEPGDPLPIPNWSSPVDYYDGELRIRYQIKSPAGQLPGQIQTCIWTMPGYSPESCSDQTAFSGVGTFHGSKLAPSSWWKKDNVPVDFSHPEKFLIRTVLRGASGCNVTTYSVPGACWGEWSSYQSMSFRVTIVMVAKGATFSGWQSYP
jgi:hypothetical protein